MNALFGSMACTIAAVLAAGHMIRNHWIKYDVLLLDKHGKVVHSNCLPQLIKGVGYAAYYDNGIAYLLLPDGTVTGTGDRITHWMPRDIEKCIIQRDQDFAPHPKFFHTFSLKFPGGK